MNASIIMDAFDEREPIVRDEIQDVLKIKNINTLNQMVSYLVSFGILKRYENGIYYVPSSTKKFSHLKPSLKDVIDKKYLQKNQGIRTGSYLLYKYKFTSQVSSFYEILSNNVSIHTRSKHLYDGKVVVSHPPFEINIENGHVLEFLELIKYLDYSDYNMEKSKSQLLNILDSLGLKIEEIIHYSEYYKGKRYAGFRETVRKVVYDEVTSK
ncbi:hypothetical protein HF295_02805 [Hujiaoplasma nucleasis]|uniref:Uncharacterized protein n=1 Tax=Hujiaoplasma nucleasis TaxID=2725268 RepID=A0A7L6N4B6_9MOLU|nr:hypothetical protein [Hujiaoplasma nucleasis]QLY39845.1 hypothetical protein HF295_02805 [Hujiaoplasma nucleasis]